MGRARSSSLLPGPRGPRAGIRLLVGGGCRAVVFDWWMRLGPRVWCLCAGVWGQILGLIVSKAMAKVINGFSANSCNLGVPMRGGKLRVFYVTILATLLLAVPRCHGVGLGFQDFGEATQTLSGVNLIVQCVCIHVLSCNMFQVWYLNFVFQHKIRKFPMKIVSWDVLLVKKLTLYLDIYNIYRWFLNSYLWDISSEILTSYLITLPRYFTGNFEADSVSCKYSDSLSSS